MNNTFHTIDNKICLCVFLAVNSMNSAIKMIGCYTPYRIWLWCSVCRKFIKSQRNDFKNSDILASNVHRTWHYYQVDVLKLRVDGCLLWMLYNAHMCYMMMISLFFFFNEIDKMSCKILKRNYRRYKTNIIMTEYV